MRFSAAGWLAGDTLTREAGVTIRKVLIERRNREALKIARV